MLKFHIFNFRYICMCRNTRLKRIGCLFNCGIWKKCKYCASALIIIQEYFFSSFISKESDHSILVFQSLLGVLHVVKNLKTQNRQYFFVINTQIAITTIYTEIKKQLKPVCLNNANFSRLLIFQFERIVQTKRIHQLQGEYKD